LGLLRFETKAMAASFYVGPITCCCCSGEKNW